MSAAPWQPPAGPFLVVAEVQEGELAPVTKELAACARELGAALARPWRLVVPAADPQPLAQEAAALGGGPVLALAVEGLEHPVGEAYLELLAQLAAQEQAAGVLAAHTTSGLSWAPGLAARLEAAYVSGVESLASDEKGLLLGRAGQHGKLMEQVRPLAGPLVITVQPGAFGSSSDQEIEPAPVELRSMSAPPSRARVLAQTSSVSRDAALTSAPVVVAAGRGVGKPENLEPLRRLAGLFTGGVLAGSRPLCDLGWLDYSRQVGLTGATITPRLYIACGISGARQHTVGMQGSGLIVAINSDPQAAIFNLADVGVVEDLGPFLAAFMALARPDSGGEDW